MEITLTVNKEDVMREVAVTTTYTGAKMDKDENALQRISTVDEDESHLERFWEESRADLCQELLGLVTDEGMKTMLPTPSRATRCTLACLSHLTRHSCRA